MTACENEQWAAENGESVEWARTMWFCPCEKCVVPADLPQFEALPGAKPSEQIHLAALSAQSERAEVER